MSFNDIRTSLFLALEASAAAGNSTSGSEYRAEFERRSQGAAVTNLDQESRERLGDNPFSCAYKADNKSRATAAGQPIW